MLFLAAFAAFAQGRVLDLSFGYPFYSPRAGSYDPGLQGEESKGYLSAGFAFEPAAFLAVGPRLGWSFWDFRPDAGDDAGIRKWELGCSVMPQKRLPGNTRLFLEASIGAEHVDSEINSANADPGGQPVRKEGGSRSSWGFGSSFGAGFEFRWLRVSVHRDAFLVKTLFREFSGPRAAIGIVFRSPP